MSQPLMPKATAVWLIDNTALTFDQIADFCTLHPLEVKGIADGDVAAGVRGVDPVANGQLTREELAKAEADSSYKMKMLVTKHAAIQEQSQKRKGARYTPVSRRQDRPNAILWMVRNHPEVSDAQIGKLLGTTKPTIQSVRDRTHWNSSNLKPVDPVTLGLSSQIELDAVVRKAAARKAKMEAANPPAEEGETLKPTEETLQPEEEAPLAEAFANPTLPAKEEEEEPDADAVFGNFAKSEPEEKE